MLIMLFRKFNKEEKQSIKQLKTVVLLVVMGVLSALSPIQAQATVTLFDETFNNDDWVTTITSTAPGASIVTQQVLNGGNPGAYQNIQLSLLTGIHATHFNSNLVYDPASGAISKIKFSADLKGPTNTSYSIGLIQNGVLYEGSPFLGRPLSSSWTSYNVFLEESDFHAHLPGTGSPDFSTSGAEIVFGFHTENTGIPNTPIVKASDIDNFKVEIKPPATGTSRLIFEDHFNGPNLDSNWEITFGSTDNGIATTNGWDFDVNSTLTVRGFTGQTFNINDWGGVFLTRTVPALRDFNIEMKISWDSAGTGSNLDRAVQFIFVKAFPGNVPVSPCSCPDRLFGAGYFDPWGDDTGTRKYQGWNSGPSSLPAAGSALIEIERSGDIATMTWDGIVVHSQTISTEPAEKIQIVIAGFENTASIFGTIFVDSIIVTGIPINENPTAEAGMNQSIHAGQTVNLDGTGSSDDSTASEDLLYDWSITTKPGGSTSVLTAFNTSTPSFIADLPGDYIVSLVVTDDGGLPSDPDQVMVSSLNTPPNADAGSNQGTYVRNLVTLNGSGSNDPDMDPLTYLWSLTALPTGSLTILNGESTADPTFIPDLPGNYNVNLVVNDGFSNSTPDQLVVSVISPEDYAGGETIEAINEVGALPSGSVTTTGNRNALVNFLTQVIEALQEDNIAKAIEKLEKAIERTDGCELRNAVDLSGGGQIKQDYINNCSDQMIVYPLLDNALESLLTL